MTANVPDYFRTRAFISNFAEYLEAFPVRSEATRARLRSHLNLAYGETPAERLDIFLPEASTSTLPVHIFVHGGYWRMFSKDDFSFVADTVVGAGAIAVIVDYALMPSVRLDTVVDQVRRATQWVRQHIRDYGGDPARLTVSGHSAGAHLCAWLFDASREADVKAALLLGGIYDIRPLQSSFLKDEIALTDEEVNRWSPLDATFHRGVDVSVLVGADETPPFHQQTEAFVQLLSRQGLPARAHTLPSRNHMSSMLDLGSSASDAGALLSRMIAGH